jgi:ParB family chromosome partitioning protein
MSTKRSEIKLTSLDDLFSTQEDRDEVKREKVMDIPLSELHPFKDHPFQVNDNEELRELARSIAENGMVSPAIARPRKDGGYELIAGHRRKAACEIAGIETMPVLVREMDDDTSTIVMVDSNKQRENLLPSEKAWSYKMKMDAIKRQVGRPSKENCGQVDHNYLGQKSRDIIADESTDSSKQIQRYIRLTNLIPELLIMVDYKRIAFNPGVELSYLPKETQNILLEAMNEQDCTPSLSQAVRMKTLHNEGKLEADMIVKMLSEPKANQREKISFRHEQLKQYFPKSYTPKQIEESIIKMLDERQRKLQKQREAER